MTVVLTSGPSVTHLLRSEVSTVPGAVLTWCGKRGFPGESGRKCLMAAKDGGQ